MRSVLVAAAFLAAGAATSSWAAAPNDIIWDTPAAKEGASKENMTPLARTSPAAQPDKNGIIWDTPAATAAKPEAAPAAAVRQDANGITWNAAPVKPSSAPPSGALLTPPRSAGDGGRLAQAPASSTDGPCREFQTTIVIEGKTEPAHGTVCQQADGTWRVVNK